MSAPSGGELAAFRERGCLVLKRVFRAQDLEPLADETAELARREDLIQAGNLRCRFQQHVDTREALFDCFDPVTDIAPRCRALARDERILSILRGLYAEEPRLFKDKLIFKPPGAAGYPLHQDYIGWKGFPESFLTVVIPIDPATAENGAIEVIPGEHAKGYLTRRDGEYHRLSASRFAASTWVRLELEPGDIALIGAFAPHRSGVNRSQRWRRQLMLSYNADSDGGDQRDAHYQQYFAWLRKQQAALGRQDGCFR